MVLSITAALVAAGALGMWFFTTRGMSVAAIADLVFMFPWLAVLVLIGSVTAFYLFRIRK